MAKIKHIALSTQDVDKTAKFYIDVFGMKEIARIDSPGARGYYLSDGDLNLAILNFKNDAVAGVERGKGWSGIHHIGFQVESLEAIAERLAALGLPIDPADVFALVREGSAGRPHIAQVMVQKGYVATVGEAFDRYLAAGGPAYVSHRKVDPREACAIIHRAGGVAVMAHPGFHAAAEALVRDLAGEARLDGVECYYSDHTPDQTARFLALCRALDLVTTGGSDFHGPAVRAATLGQPPVPWDAYEALRRRAGR